MSKQIKQTRTKPAAKPARILPKPGQYTSKQLEGSKKIYSATGGKY